MKKRHLVLTVLVLALGAAVYLNWQLAPDVVTTGDNLTESSVTSDGEQKVLGEAAYVDAKQDESVETGSNSSIEYFENARLSRENSHSDALKELEEIISNAELEEKTKAEAVSAAAQLTKSLESEQKLENLIKAKGFNDVIVTIGKEQISVVVKCDGGLNGNQAAIIKDLVVAQMNVPSSDVRIIEAK